MREAELAERLDVWEQRTRDLFAGTVRDGLDRVMADTIERDAQTASAAQLRRTEEEVSRRQRELQERQADVDKYRQESERLRAEILDAVDTLLDQAGRRTTACRTGSPWSAGSLRRCASPARCRRRGRG